MYAVNVTIKVQYELVKKAIILALKDWSNDLFQNNGLMLRCFVDRTENQVEIFHVFRTKKEMEEVVGNHYLIIFEKDEHWKQEFELDLLCKIILRRSN